MSNHRSKVSDIMYILFLFQYLIETNLMKCNNYRDSNVKENSRVIDLSSDDWLKINKTCNEYIGNNEYKTWDYGIDCSFKLSHLWSSYNTSSPINFLQWILDLDLNKTSVKEDCKGIVSFLFIKIIHSQFEIS